MEVVQSLSTQSCNGFQEVYSAPRRGAPIEVYSVNGTCFIGASRCLKKEIREINEKCAVNQHANKLDILPTGRTTYERSVGAHGAFR